MKKEGKMDPNPKSLIRKRELEYHHCMSEATKEEIIGIYRFIESMISTVKFNLT